MTQIDHIVFDIGKVLIHYDPDLPFSRLIPDEAERRWFSTMCARRTGTLSRIAAAPGRRPRRC